MKFVVNTKPLIDALNLTVINQNVSKYYLMSCVVQLTATKNSLTVNVEASRIFSQATLKGMGDSDGPVVTYVDTLLFKQLVSTFETATTTLEFTDGGLVLYSGKSKFSLGKMVSEEDADISLKVPTLEGVSQTSIPVDKQNWRFVKDKMLYALAMSYAEPIYTYVYLGDQGDVITGDFEAGLFVHSERSNLGRTCIVPDTIVNLLNSLPEGAKMYEKGLSYVVSFNSDAFSYLSEFLPLYEDDEEVGSYRSDAVLGVMTTSESGSLILDTAVINKFLSQASIFSTSTEDTIELSVENGILKLKDSNVECEQDVSGFSTDSYVLKFRTDLLKSVLSKFTGDTIYIKPTYMEDELSGMLFWDDELSTVLSVVD